MKRWDGLYGDLVAYHKKHGHCNVPQSEIYAKLGRWVQLQKKRHPSSCAAYRRPLTQDQIQRLDAVDFVWPIDRYEKKCNDKNDKKWNDKFERLKRYKLEHGDCLVPQHYKNDPLLGKWLDSQRTIFKCGTMAPCRVEQLNSIGICWDPVRGQWNEKFEALKRYKLKYGDCLVPPSYKDDPSLGAWVKNKRKIFRSGTMCLGQVEQLNSIGFCWDPPRSVAARIGYTGVEHAGSGDRKRKAQEPPCYENTSKAPPYFSPDSIVKV